MNGHSRKDFDYGETDSMRIGIMALAILLTSASVAKADCFGSESFKTCTDANGNSYNVQRFGNMTYMDGYNAQTGSHWSQNSQTYGGTTYHNGTTNGRNWDMTQQSLGGGMQSYSGTNSRGQFFSYTCTAYGCQ